MDDRPADLPASRGNSSCARRAAHQQKLHRRRVGGARSEDDGEDDEAMRRPWSAPGANRRRPRPTRWDEKASPARADRQRARRRIATRPPRPRKSSVRGRRLGDGERVGEKLEVEQRRRIARRSDLEDRVEQPIVVGAKVSSRE